MDAVDAASRAHMSGPRGRCLHTLPPVGVHPGAMAKEASWLHVVGARRLAAFAPSRDADPSCPCSASSWRAGVLLLQN